MSGATEDEIKRWTARRKVTLVLEIIHGKTTAAEVGRAFDRPSSEIKDGKRAASEALGGEEAV